MAKRTPAGVGRPTKYDPQFCIALADHLESGLSFESFAGVAKVSRKTLYIWLERHHEFKQTYEKYRECGLLALEKIGMSAMLGKIPKFQPGAWIFTMQNRTHWRNPHQQEFENAGNPIKLAYDPGKRLAPKPVYDNKPNEVKDDDGTIIDAEFRARDEDDRASGEGSPREISTEDL